LQYTLDIPCVISLSFGQLTSFMAADNSQTTTQFNTIPSSYCSFPLFHHQVQETSPLPSDCLLRLLYVSRQCILNAIVIHTVSSATLSKLIYPLNDWIYPSPRTSSSFYVRRICIHSAY